MDPQPAFARLSSILALRKKYIQKNQIIACGGKMKFFKHFTDAQRGTSLRAVRRTLGMAGIGQYWNLVETCAEKLEKGTDETFTEAHCVFRFDLSVVADVLGTKPKQVGNILGTFQEHSLLEHITEDFIVTIKMPKLLESLD